MKKRFSAVSFLALSGVVAFSLRASAPAQAQSNAQAQGLEARVAELETDLAAVKKKNEETRALLDQTLTYLEKETKAAQTLLSALDQCEKEGFAVGENWHARQTMLAGLRAYWKGVFNQRNYRGWAAGAGVTYAGLLGSLFLLLCRYLPEMLRDSVQVFALVLLLYAAVAWVRHRIAQAEMRTAEKLLEIELRLAEIDEDTKPGPPTDSSSAQHQPSA